MPSAVCFGDAAADGPPDRVMNTDASPFERRAQALNVGHGFGGTTVAMVGAQLLESAVEKAVRGKEAAN